MLLAENGLGAIVANWLIGKYVGVERFTDRVMKQCRTQSFFGGIPVHVPGPGF